MVYCNARTRERSFDVETEQYYSHSTEDTENAGAALARKLIEKYHDAPFFVTLSRKNRFHERLCLSPLSGVESQKPFLYNSK